ncbi:MAG: GNAT family N-acetyltransferase [Coprococcus sp.]|nr:GNAT family N-acetyltransferase [Coprococcus sp.]
MDTNEIRIRPATEADAEEILNIYAPYVTDTAITFEYDVPTLEEFTGRIHHTLEKYPYLVAVRDGEIIGYAYAGAFYGRTAYDWSAETTIYIKKDCRHSGVGKLLYQALEDALKAQNIINLYACIGYPEVDDEYLTKNSEQFHEHLGYRLIGEFRKCGYKFGRWYHMVWMEKMIGEHQEKPEPVKRFKEI